MQTMIVLDTETTGLPEPGAMPLSKQPQIIEFAAIKVDQKNLDIVGRLEFMCNPGVPLPDKIVQITKITDADLKDKPPFAFYYKKLCEFFLGAESVVAHNMSFDKSMIYFELLRLDKVCQFPWPPNHICTVEASFSLNNRRLSLANLHKIATGREFEGAHRAMIDVEALLRCVKWLRNKGML
jgi:DNA polymerase III epsilon subunit-like protein